MTRLALHTATVLAVLVGVLLAWKLCYPLLLFILSLSMAAAVRPLVERLMARKWAKSLSVAAVYAQLLAVVVLVLALAAQPVLLETRQLGDQSVAAYDHAVHDWPARGGWREMLAKYLPRPDEFYDNVVGEQGASWLQAALGMTFSLFSNLVDAIVVVVMSIYWSIDRDHFERIWLSILPARRRIAARDVWRSIETEAGDYLRSEIVQGLVAGFLLWGGLRLLGHPFPTLAALIGAIVWLVPWLGMILAAMATTALALPQAAATGIAPILPWLIGSVAYTILLLMVLELLIEPRVFGRRRYNSLWIAVVMVGLADVLGLVGLVLGPPLAASVHILTTRLRRQHMLGKATYMEGDLSTKITWLHSALDEADEASPELTNMVERLKTLVQDTQTVLADVPSTNCATTENAEPHVVGPTA